MPLARISLTLSRHFSLSFIASVKSSGLHPVSYNSRGMSVRAGRPAFAWPYAGVHWSTSLMSSSLLLQQYPVCLVRLTWIVFVLGGRCQYSWCLLLIGLVVRVFTNVPGDRGSIPGQVIPKTLKVVLDTSLLNTQCYKECIKGKVEQSRGRSSALPYTSV